MTTRFGIDGRVGGDTYTPLGVIRDELRAQIAGRAQRVGDVGTLQDLEGTHFGPLVSMKTDHSTWCDCERGDYVDWPIAATRHNPHRSEIPPFAWAGGSSEQPTKGERQ